MICSGVISDKMFVYQSSTDDPFKLDFASGKADSS